MKLTEQEQLRFNQLTSTGNISDSDKVELEALRVKLESPEKNVVEKAVKKVVKAVKTLKKNVKRKVR